MIELQEVSRQFARKRAELLEELRARPSGLEWCRKQTELADDFLEAIFDKVAASHSDAVSLIAVGGYGRRELAPFSDVDLLVVPFDDADPLLDEIIRNLHRELHAAFTGEPKMALSYAFFLVNDAPALDPKTRTAVLDARLVCGSSKAFKAFTEAFRSHFQAGEFLLEKVRERRADHAKWNDTPLAVEPNLKEGAGGLRSFQCANWIRSAIGASLVSETSAYDHVELIRNALHLAAGTNMDRFTRVRQAEVADLLDAELSSLVSQTAEAALALFGEYEKAETLIRTSNYLISDSVTASGGFLEIDDEASLSGAAHGVAVGSQLGLEVKPGRSCASQEIDGPEALYAVGTGEKTLRELDRCGLLNGLLPELGRCRTLMPEDAVHTYSVFEHSLRVVRQIESFPAESFYGRLRDGLSSSAPLYLAALLHDTGKSEVGRPHSVVGAEIAKAVCSRWRLSPGVSDFVEWLVREHLTLARFIGMRDVSNPLTAKEFAQVVGDRERLDSIAVLTCADVSAVGENTWTPAQDAFLKELHGRTSAILESEQAVAMDPAVYRRRLLRTLRDHPVPDAEIEAFLERLPAQYAISTPAEMVPVHIELVKKAEEGEVSVFWDHDRERNLSEVTVCVPDAPGLLSRILGVLYAFDLSVHGLRAHTTLTLPSTPNALPIVLDTVLVSFGRQQAPQATCSLATKALVEVLNRRASLAELLRSHGKDPERLQENFRYNFVEGTPGILEVQAPRGRGMAFRMAKMIFGHGWNIVSARFGQWAGRGAAAFYVLGPDGATLSKADVDRAFEVREKE